jgi:hypothetical protein
MSHQEPVRRRLRLASALVLLFGIACLVYGSNAGRLRSDPVPEPVPTSQVVQVPDRGLFGATVALYGAPTTGLTPSAAQLGCQLRDPGGHSRPAALSTAVASTLDHVVVGNTALLPLLAVEHGGHGWTLRCDGPYAATSQPLYLMAGAGVRALVPMAAYSIAALTLVLGLGGLAAFRRPA